MLSLLGNVFPSDALLICCCHAKRPKQIQHRRNSFSPRCMRLHFVPANSSHNGSEKYPHRAPASYSTSRRPSHTGQYCPPAPPASAAFASSSALSPAEG